jgi:hypothetical protein
VKQIEAALSPLIGLPLWESHRAANLQMFDFGQARTRTIQLGPRKGTLAEVREYSLHIQCAWRARGPEGIVVGSNDGRWNQPPRPQASHVV